MYLAFLAQVLLSALLVSAVTPTRTLSKRQTTTPSKFVTSQNGQFMFNGRCVFRSIYPLSPYRFAKISAIDFVGTNAYWLPALNSDQDIDSTLGNLSAAGVKVVRTWAFNGVFSALVSTLASVPLLNDIQMYTQSR
jgi:mannan endo-1,4-beta-mannosidase